MLDLLNKYSFSEILIFLVVFAIALRSIVNFWDWGVERLKKIFQREGRKKEEKEVMERKLDENSDNFKTLFEIQQKQNNKIEEVIDKINLLIVSDKDDIKSFITREHHYFCYQKGWIDDYSLDCIERRFQHYTEEGGNSYILDLMTEIRNLPKRPPKKEE